jgi:transcriptional regulator with XRE-family HTH domain
MTVTSTQRQLVGSALRRYRANVGYALEDAAKVLDCDRSKISRVETGQRGIRPKELRELLTEYGVCGAEQDVLSQIARTARRSWWQEYDSAAPWLCREWLAMESAATEIMIWDGLHIPDLLQTPAYAAAVADACPALTSQEARDLAVALTMARQQRAAEQPCGPRSLPAGRDSLAVPPPWTAALPGSPYPAGPAR